MTSHFEMAEANCWVTSGGKKVYSLAGLSDNELSETASDELKPDHFPVKPDEVKGWESMSKNGLKKAMADLRWNKLRDERQRRKLLKAAPTSRKRPRDDSSTGNGGSGLDDESYKHTPAGLNALRQSELAAAVKRGIKVAIDCQFDEFMTQKERHSLAEQIKQAYGSIRTAAHPINLYLTSVSPSSEAYGSLARVTGFLPSPETGHVWPINVYSESFQKVFSADGGGLVDLRLKSTEATSVNGSTAPAMSASLGLGVTSACSASSAASVDPAASTEDNAISTGDAETQGEDQYASCSASSSDGPASSASSSISAAAGQALHHAVDGGSSARAMATANSSSRDGQSLSSQPTRLVYLSADSPHELSRMEQGTVYVIGGLIDRNRHKGLTQARAEAAGIPTARLPIDAYVQLQASRMLTTLHVVQILLAWQECKDWRTAFLSVIPQRKGAVAKRVTDQGDDGSEKEGVAGGGSIQAVSSS